MLNLKAWSGDHVPQPAVPSFYSLQLRGYVDYTCREAHVICRIREEGFEFGQTLNVQFELTTLSWTVFAIHAPQHTCTSRSRLQRCTPVLLARWGSDVRSRGCKSRLVWVAYMLQWAGGFQRSALQWRIDPKRSSCSPWQSALFSSSDFRSWQRRSGGRIVCGRHRTARRWPIETSTRLSSDKLHALLAWWWQRGTAMTSSRSQHWPKRWHCTKGSSASTTAFSRESAHDRRCLVDVWCRLHWKHSTTIYPFWTRLLSRMSLLSSTSQILAGFILLWPRYSEKRLCPGLMFSRKPPDCICATGYPTTSQACSMISLCRWCKNSRKHQGNHQSCANKFHEKFHFSRELVFFQQFDLIWFDLIRLAERSKPYTIIRGWTVTYHDWWDRNGR